MSVFDPKPGQIDRRTSDEATEFRLVLKQVLGMGVLLDLGVLVVWLLVLGPWAVNNWKGMIRFLLPRGWLWAVGSLVVVWLGPCAFGIWRFAAEIVDPSYPTPRQPLPPELQRQGPRWPGQGDLEYEGEDEGPVEHHWDVKVQIKVDSSGRELYVNFKIPVKYVDAWQRYCKALTRDQAWLRPRFSTRAAQIAGLPYEVFKPIQDRFVIDGLAVKLPSANGSGEVKLKGLGRAVARAFAETTPPLL